MRRTNDNGTAATQPRRRRRRRLIAVVSLLVLLILLWQGPRWWGRPANTGIVISPETTVIDGPLTRDGRVDYQAALNKRYRQGLGPKDNGAILLWSVLQPDEDNTEEYINAGREFGLKFAADTEDALMSEDAFWETLAEDKRRSFEEQLLVARSQPWVDRDHPELARLLARNSRQLDVVVEASKRPRYVEPNWWGTARRAVRDIAALLQLRTMRYLGQGDLGSAKEQVMAVHQLARFAAEGPFLIDLLVGLSVDASALHSQVVLTHFTPLNGDQLLAHRKDIHALSRDVVIWVKKPSKG